jgi:hypothetical protein
VRSLSEDHILTLPIGIELFDVGDDHFVDDFPVGRVVELVMTFRAQGDDVSVNAQSTFTSGHDMGVGIELIDILTAQDATTIISFIHPLFDDFRN